MVSFIFKKRTVWWPINFKYESVTTVFFGFGWLVATPAASQQYKKISFLATSTLLQVPVPVPVLKFKYQYKYQYFACKYKYQYQYSKNVLKYNLSTSTSTKYNKTVYMCTMCVCWTIDGDLITVVDSSDLSFAIQNCRRVLQLTLFGEMRCFCICCIADCSICDNTFRICRHQHYVYILQ